MGSPSTTLRRSSKLHRGRGLLALAAALGLAGTAAAQTIVNGGFEAGPIGGVPTGWTAGGTGRVEVLQLGNFTVTGSNNLTIPEGANLVLLSTGPGNTGGGATDIDGNGTPEYDVVTLSQVIDAGAGGTVLSLKWAFLTAEANEALAFDDVFRVSVDGAPVLTGSVNKPGGSSPYPDTPPYDPGAGRRYDGSSYTVASAGPTDGSVFGGTADDGFSGWNLFSVILSPGTHTLELLVADQNDAEFDSGLLIDDVSVVGGQNLFQLTDTAGSFVEAKDGGIVWRPFQSTLPTVSDDGFTFSFLSSGNSTGNNPSGQLQVFTLGASVSERLTTMVEGSASRPSVSADGRYVAYAATDDPLGTNPDLNQEIFLHDRTTGDTLQVTDTTGCANSNPSTTFTTAPVIAFQSTCTGLVGAPNSDGNAEIVVWDGAAFRSIADTTGCVSRGPELAAAGGHVAFVSSCNLAGGNDGNEEVFRWDLVGNGVLQLTDIAAGSGVLVDGASISSDGARVVFVSNGNLDGGPAAPLGYEVFLWHGGGTITRLTDSGLKLNIVGRLENSGSFVAVERLDLLGGPSEILLLGISDPATPGVSTVATGGTVALPDLGLDLAASEAVVVFQAQDDLVAGGNLDGNWEVFTSRLAVQVQPPVQTYCSAPNLASPDFPSPGVSDTLTVPAIGTVTDVDVYLRIDHTWVGDLQVRLRNASIADRLILNRIRNGNGNCQRDDIDAVLDDEAALEVRNRCENTTPTILSPPSYRPYTDALSAFDGGSVGGAWTLTVTDTQASDVGRLIEWCVVLTVTP